MPLPEKKPNERATTFINRCMTDSVMIEEYPDRKQRYAVCLAQWNK